VLQDLIAEMKQRESLLAARGHLDALAWNAAEPERLSLVLVVIDEVARLAAAQASPGEKKLCAEIEALLALLAQGGRATWIRMLTTAQLAKVETLPSPIRSQLTHRVIFRMEDADPKVVGLKHLSAGRLALHPGRAVLSRDGEECEVQVPLLKREEVAPLLGVTSAGAPPAAQPQKLEVLRSERELT
jgi:DNA segregation ATPase FtsK/SpoIIIE-like protein